jgi:hypothetical protein
MLCHCIQAKRSLTPKWQAWSHLLLSLLALLLTNTSNSKPNFLNAHWRSSSDVPGAWPPNLQHTQHEQRMQECHPHETPV